MLQDLSSPKLAASEASGRVWWGFVSRVQEVSVRYVDVHNVIYNGQGINTDCYQPIKSCSEIDLTKLIASGSALFSRP